MGEGWGKQGQFTSNLSRGRTIPVTAGGRQVSGKGVQRGVEKKTARGARGSLKRAKEPRHVYT